MADSKLTCRRCGRRLDPILAGAGVHVICCDLACERWPCDGAHLDKVAA